MESARRATIGDLPALDELARAARDERLPLRGGELWALTLGRGEPMAEALERELTDPARRVVVGLIDDTPVGYGVVRLQGLPDGRHLGVIDDLFTLPEARGIGVGEAMMDLLLAFCLERRCTGIDAVALPGDRETKNFFETFGLTARAIVVHRSLDPDR